MVKKWLALVCIMLYGVGTNVLPSVCGLFQDVATMCPYNNFCNSNATKSRTPDEMHLTPCCQKCSCDRDCQLFGNCCPDMTPMPSVKQKYPCVDLNYYFNEPRGIYPRRNGGYNLAYRIVDTCPNAGLDRVYPRCSTLVKLEDCILVSDPLTDRLYRNKHCAMCNGVNQEGLIEWNLITNCIPYSNQSTIEEWHEHIMRNCLLIPHPPNPSVSQLVRCQLKVKNRCNSTKNWDMYNQDVKDACELEIDNVNSIYTLETDLVTHYYQNVYCYQCNARHDQLLSGLCENADFSKSRVTVVDLSILINFQEQSTDGTKQTERCDSSQIWNPFNGSCLAVRCPFATYAHNGKCEDLHRYLRMQTFKMIFRLKKSDDIYSYELLIFLNRTVTRMLANADCTHCETGLIVDSNANSFLTYTLTSAGSCTDYFIVSKMKTFLKYSPINRRFGNTTKISLVPELKHQQFIFESYLYLVYSGFCFDEPIELTWAIVDKCPRIPIASLGFNETTMITTERNGTICVEEYFSIMTSLNTNNCEISVPCYWVIYVISIVVCSLEMYGKVL